MRKKSFAPILPRNPKILILGSMPGEKSLEMQQYYAHAYNLFWPLISTVCDCKLPEDYHSRTELLKYNHIALWDVCNTCFRDGSMDTAIREERPNPITALINAYPSIRLVAFNGQKAAALFRKHFPDISIPTLTLPSSSPANAGKSRTEKEKHWLQLRDYLQQ